LLILPEKVELPLNEEFLYSIAGIYVPKEKKIILPELFNNKNYQRSLKGLDSNKVMNSKRLERILQE